MKLPEYTYHKIPPHGFDSAVRAERRRQTARDRLPIPTIYEPVSYDLPGKGWHRPRSQAAGERLRFFMAERFPPFMVGVGATWALLLLADCWARAVS